MKKKGILDLCPQNCVVNLCIHPSLMFNRFPLQIRRVRVSVTLITDYSPASLSISLVEFLISMIAHCSKTRIQSCKANPCYMYYSSHFPILSVKSHLFVHLRMMFSFVSCF